jgi:hypothetical protein
MGLRPLDLWRIELRAGRRRNTGADFDCLAAAACFDVRARELERAGDLGAARDYRDVATLRLFGYVRVGLGEVRAPAVRELLAAVCPPDDAPTVATVRPAAAPGWPRPTRRTWA